MAHPSKYSLRWMAAIVVVHPGQVASPVSGLDSRFLLKIFLSIKILNIPTALPNVVPAPLSICVFMYIHSGSAFKFLFRPKMLIEWNEHQNREAVKNRFNLYLFKMMVFWLLFGLWFVRRWMIITSYHNFERCVFLFLFLVSHAAGAVFI